MFNCSNETELMKELEIFSQNENLFMIKFINK